MKTIVFFLILISCNIGLASVYPCRSSLSIREMERYSIKDYITREGQLQAIERKEIEIINDEAIVFSDLSFNTKKLDNFFSKNSQAEKIRSISQTLVDEYVEVRHWTEDFAKLILKEVKDDLPYTRYFLTETLPKDDSPKIQKAMLKLIFANQSEANLLPVERHLGLNLKYNNGLKIEPSNFINLDKKPDSIPQVLKLWFAYTRSVISKNKVKADEALYYTYGNIASVKMYSQYGFVRSKETYKDSEGTEWYLLTATPNQVMNSRFLRKKLEQNDKEYLADIVYLSEKTYYPRLGKTTNQVFNFGKSIKNLRESHIVSEHIANNYELSVFTTGGNTLVHFKIPDNFRLVKTFNFDGYRYQYKDNQLMISRNENKIHEYLIIDLKENKDFSPRSIRHHLKIGQIVVYSYEAFF